MLAGHQVLQEAADAVLVVATEQLQPLAQVFQHPDPQPLEALTPPGIERGAAPGQLVGHLAGASPFLPGVAVAQQHEHQHVAPGLFQEVADDLRQLAAFEEARDGVHRALTGFQQAVAAFGCFHRAALTQLDLVAQRGDVFVELVL